MPRFYNYNKIKDVIERYFMNDPEFKENYERWEILDRQNSRVRGRKQSDLRDSNILLRNTKTIFYPDIDRIKAKIEEYEKLGNTEAVEELKSLLNIGVTTGAVTLMSEDIGGKKRLRDTYIVSEKFMNEMFNFWKFENFKDFFYQNRNLISNFYNKDPNKLPENLIKLMHTYQFLKVHEILGHIRARDLIKKYRGEYEKYFSNISNDVHDLRIHALREGLLFPELFNDFIQFFKNGIYAHTFRNSLKHLDILTDIIKNNLSKEDALKKYDKEIVDKIDFDKINQDRENANKIVENVYNKIEDYLKYFVQKRFIDFDYDIKEKLPLEVIEDFLYKFKDAFEKHKFIPHYPRKYEDIFLELSLLQKYVKVEEGEGGEGTGKGGGSGIPHDNDNPSEPSEGDPLADDFDDKEFENEQRRREKEEEEINKEFSRKRQIDPETFSKGRETGQYEEKIDRNKIIIEELEEQISRFIKEIKSESNKTIRLNKELLFTGAVPDYFEANLDKFLNEDGFFHEGFAGKKLIKYTVEPVIFTFIDNSGSMGMHYGNTPLINIFKNAVINTLCEKDIPVINIDWDTKLKDVNVINKNHPSYEKSIEDFMKFKGQGGTSGFGEFYAKFDKILHENYDLFKKELEKINMTPEDVLEKWNKGEMIVVYLTDGEFFDFKDELKVNPNYMDLLNKAKALKIKPFNFLVPHENTNLIRKYLAGLEDFYKTYPVFIEKLKK